MEKGHHSLTMLDVLRLDGDALGSEYSVNDRRPTMIMLSGLTGLVATDLTESDGTGLVAVMRLADVSL